MDQNQRVILAKKICQLFVAEKKCRTTSEVNRLLEDTDDKTLLEFAVKKGLKVSESDKNDLLKAIWQTKSFYGASPSGSKSYWNVMS